MCGFAAVFSAEKKQTSTLLDAFDRDLFHRGPDSGGRFHNEKASMVFRRLAIMDPNEDSNQPMHSQNGQFVMVFNGEVYNFKALRGQLEQFGCQFRTRGDSEVLLSAFQIWGKSAFEKLEGMFACVIFDQVRNRCIAARDPLGIKPLYMAHDSSGIAFASEARPLRRWANISAPDTDALAELLMYRFAAGTRSNFENIELVPGGHTVEFDLQNNTKTISCFDDPLDSFAPNADMTHQEALDLSEEALTTSIRQHMQSDVGYSLQFSGGVDSSLVLAMVERHAGRPVDSYAVKLEDERYDEGIWRQAVLREHKTNHHEVSLSATDFANALPRAVHHMEGPTPHFGCVMLLMLCDEIAKKDKVVLTGEGADEFFGGYDRYSRWRELRKFNFIGKVVPRPFWPLLTRYSYLQRFNRFDAAIVSSVYFDFLELHKIFPDLVPGFGHRDKSARRFKDFRDRMMAVDQSSYLSSLLMRQDKMAMAAGVEARVPFAHMPLAKVINKIPRHLRVPGGDTKPLLKEIARKWLPTKVVDRRKVGLTLPLEEWLRDENALGQYLPLLTDANSQLATYGDKKKLRKLVDDFRNGFSEPGMPPLSHLVNMELWLRDIKLPIS